MTDHHLALHAEGGGPFEDQVEREGAHLARLVQVDVDRLAVARRQCEQRIEAAHRIAVDGARIDPAHDIGAIQQCSIHQRLGSRAVCQAGLGKRDDLHVDRIGERVARPHRRMDMREPDLGVDVGVRADARGAIGQEGTRQRQRPCRGVVI